MEIKYKQLLLPCLILYSPFSLAEGEPSFTIGAGIEYTDNIKREADDKKSSTTKNLNGQLGFASNEEWYRYNLNYSSNFQYYNSSYYDDRSNTNGSASLVIGKSNSWFSWLFKNTETSTQLDSTAADRPTNRSQRSTYATGPSLNFRLSKRDTLVAHSEFQRTKVENSATDTDRLNHNLSWNHLLSKKTSFMVSGNRSIIEPEISQGDYTQQGYRVAANHQIKDGQVSLSVGTSEVSRSSVIGVFETDSEEYDFSISKNTRWGTLAASLNQSLSDSGLGDVNFAFDGLDIGSQVFDIEKRKSQQLNFASKPIWQNTTFSLSARKSEADRLASETTETTKGVSISVTTKLSTSLSIYGRYSYERSEQDDYMALGGSRTEDDYSIGANYRFGKNISGRCEIQREESEGNQRFTANQLLCSVSYQVF